jgi:hypothetical protein
VITADAPLSSTSRILQALRRSSGHSSRYLTVLQTLCNTSFTLQWAESDLGGSSVVDAFSVNPRPFLYGSIRPAGASAALGPTG